ncbi:hypothetical protein CDD82_3156 [Ophiocordyceps australis]|uniref:Uncharacterized protein n=1 Tax=Ophiocordyceps australis TaxID=1399860 RepID=A0A2C5ZFN7_9HYPO|nr:hypothetical protein CDD82_3156 [Ophiocordyceps australis]
MLENRGVYFGQLAALSILRGPNSSPYSLYWPLVAGPKDRNLILYGSLVLVTIITSLASNFTSTLLLSDFVIVSVSSSPKNESVFFGYPHAATGSLDYASVNMGYWTMREMPRFAEMAGSPYTADGIQDTGFSFRTPLPFVTPAERERLKSFQGSLPIIDTRTVCLRPSLTNATYQINKSSDLLFQVLWAGGNVSTDLASTDMRQTQVNCTVRGGGYLSQMTFCPFLDLGWTPAVGYSLNKDESYGLYNDSSYWNSIMVLNVSPQGTIQSSAANHLDFSPKGIWQSFDGAFGHIGVTACYQRKPDRLLFRSSMAADTIYPEQIPPFDTDNKRFATQDAINLYCTHCSPAQRQRSGRLKLVIAEDLSEQDALPAGYNPKNLTNTMPPVFSVLDLNPDAFSLVWDDNRSSLSLGILQDIFQRTGNLALMLQSFYTLSFISSYYRAFIFSKVTQNAKTQFWQRYNIPVRWTGFAGVMAIIVTHVIVLVITSGLFVTCTHHSFLSNTWPIIAQVCAIDEARAILDPDLTDNEVTAQLKSQEMHQTICRIRHRNGLLESEGDDSQDV